MRTATREAVFEAISGERDYQERRWGGEPSGGKHSVAEYLVYMQDYITEAVHQVSRGADPAASEAALNTIRKVVTMGVACMEQNGAPRRAA